MSRGTTFPSLTADQFVQRIARTFPRGWAGDAAKTQAGNIFYSVIYSMSTQLTYALEQMQYALNAQRMQTETGPELDLASEDFFGTALPRPGGMSDANFFQLIQANLFTTKVTRGALSQAITTLTGTAPRLIEPWNPADTGCRDTPVSYRDVDTPQNPMLNADGFLEYQGFIISLLPSAKTLGNQPLLTRDDTGYRDANEYRVLLQTLPADTLTQTIEQTKAYGVRIWLKIADPSGSVIT